MKKILLGLFFIIAIHNTSHAVTYYVNQSATGNGNGFSWANAFPNLQSALSVAIFGDEIWVAAGTYKPTTTTDINVAFEMRNGVNLYGGFSGTETAINQRNIDQNPTTLSGDIGQIGSVIDNSQSIMRILNMTSDFVLDGFRIISAYDPSGNGGGIYAEGNQASNITIRNCFFFNNYAYRAGGACFLDESNVTFEDCRFISNSSDYNGGGAIYADNVSDSNLYFYRCEFIGNTGDIPVITFDGPELIMDRCIINNNTANSRDIIVVGTDTTNFQLTNSLIVGNLVTSSSSRIISTYCSTFDAINFVNVTIAHNRNSSSVGATTEPVRSYNRGININNSIIYGNTSYNLRQIDSGNYINNSIIEGGYGTGTNVMNIDPLFANASSLNNSPFDLSSYDYSLTSASEAVNAGNNARIIAGFEQDVYGNARIQHGTVDLGAIESPFSLSVGEFNELAAFDVYPNPVDTTLNIKTDAVMTQISIYDLNGSKVHTTIANSTHKIIDVSELSSGIYFVKVQTNTGMQTQKLIKK